MTDAIKPLCAICGEPMPDGEEMFKFHGYSGDCPKPPLKKTEVVAEYILRDMRDGEFWLDIKVHGGPGSGSIGPFDTAEERQRAYDDLLSMMRSLGAKDLPAKVQ